VHLKRPFGDKNPQFWKWGKTRVKYNVCVGKKKIEIQWQGIANKSKI